MSAIDDLIPPGETILWRWPGRISLFTLDLVPVILVPVFAAFWYFGLFDRGVLWLFAVIAVLEARQWFKLRKIVTGIAVTHTSILVSRGQFPRRWERLDKQDIDYLTLRENRGHLYLHRARGGTLEILDMGDISAPIRALGLPVKIWPKKKATGTGRTILYFCGALVPALWALSAAGLAITVWYLKGSVLDSVIEDVVWLVVGLGSVLLCLAAACMIAGAIGVFLARAAGGDALAQFVHAAGDPAWTGYRNKPGPIFRYLNAVARLTGAAPVTADTVEPIIVNGPLPGSAGAFGEGE